MTPTPLYHPRSDGGAYQLRYVWTGWPSSPMALQPPEHLIQATRARWEGDGLRVLEHRWTAEMVQIVFSATPDVSPEVVAARAKGRLDHALRAAKVDLPFSRKGAVRAIGENTRRDIDAYLERQVARGRFADERCAPQLDELTVVDPNVDLSAPAESARGRYWYNLHLVLCAVEHEPFGDVELLRTLRDGFLKIAVKKDMRLRGCP